MSKKSLRLVVDAVENKGGWLAILGRMWGKDAEDYCEQYHDQKLEALMLSEKFYLKHERPKVWEKIKEFKKENPELVSEAQERRKKEREEKLFIKTQELEALFQHRGSIEEKEKLIYEVENLQKSIKSKIDDEMLELARNYPIEKLVEINSKNFALCLGHTDKNPSMYCKGNYAHCFSCGYQADTIKIYMDTHNAGFEEAVKFLSNSL